MRAVAEVKLERVPRRVKRENRTSMAAGLVRVGAEWLVVTIGRAGVLSAVLWSRRSVLSCLRLRLLVVAVADCRSVD